METLAAQILDELKLQEDQVRIGAMYRHFVAQLRDLLCDDLHVVLGPDGLQELGWEGVTWSRVKDALEVEARRQKLEPGFRGSFAETFERVLLARGLERNDFDTLMKFKKEAAQSFHNGGLDLETAQKRLEDDFPPDLAGYKPYLRKALKALALAL